MRGAGLIDCHDGLDIRDGAKDGQPMNTDFWRIAEDARIAAQAHDAQRELKELARQYRDEINIKVGWMIRSNAQRRRRANTQKEIK